ncbi:MAG: DUF4252 domain-containing protein [Saprospiraceae bacterium]
MRHSVIILLLIGSIFSELSAQKSIDHILRKYKNDQGVMVMNFTGDVLKMINQSDKKIQSTIDEVEILVFEEKQDIDVSDRNKIKGLLTQNKFDLLIDIKNKNQKVQLYAIEGQNYLNKVYASVNVDEFNAYFILSGKIIFSELAKLGMDFQNVDGMKLLDGAKKKKNK